jgi:hypothetical protein
MRGLSSQRCSAKLARNQCLRSRRRPGPHSAADRAGHLPPRAPHPARKLRGGFTTVGACGRRSGAGQVQECGEEVGVALVADGQPPTPRQPGDRVGSGRGAVPPFRMVRFPGPHLRTGRASSPASGSPQARAGGLLLIIIRSPSMALGSARPGSGSGSPSRARSAAAPLCRGSATTLVGSGGVATPNSLVGACGAAIAGPGSR